MDSIKRAARVLLWTALACAAASVPARAQNFPSRPIHLILPYNPGGIVDFAGRVLAKELTGILGQTVVAENKPGAGGIVGVNEVARGTPDGYNVVLIDPSIVINQTLHKSMAYDVFKDLVTISIVCSSPHVLIVSPQLGVKTYAELVAYGKSNPGKLNFGSAGVGTTPHLAGVMWSQETGITATHVPYKGVGPSFIDLMSGKIQMEFSSIAGALPFTSKGSVIPLATTGKTRSPVYPNLPTVEEEGLAGFDVEVWLGLYGTAGTPPSVLATLNGAVAKALQADEVKTAFAKFGIEPRGTSLEQGAAFTKAEYEKWRKVILDGHITLD
ncbi:MAG TPA: tripartite tricarboxylate transporter substrate binding protein [Xanthobacteraceae bacterium]|nr:tripartite tricarboxylate transporter substrate binding protein [Xanthobacteraceae bacterium]